MSLKLSNIQAHVSILRTRISISNSHLQTLHLKTRQEGESDAFTMQAEKSPVLFSTKRRLFHSCIFLCSNNIHIHFMNLRRILNALQVH